MRFYLEALAIQARTAGIVQNKAAASQWFIAATCLFSFGHWIGGTVAIAMGFYMAI